MAHSTTFRYEPLDAGTASIRLLQTVPRADEQSMMSFNLKGFDLLELMQIQSKGHAPYTKDTMLFAALSYEWGPIDGVETILINGDTCEISQNLYSFLRIAQSKGVGAWYWIDAICIDQSNDAEKAVQVHRISMIYRAAFMVIVWLGEGDSEVSTAFENIRKTVDWEATRDVELDDRSIHELLQNYDRMRELSYWNRLWIVQELTCARQAVLTYGKDILPWEAFCRGIVQLRLPMVVEYDTMMLVESKMPGRGTSALDWLQRYPIEGFEIFMNLQHCKMFTLCYRSIAWDPNNRTALMTLMHAYEKSQCKLVKDRIYALLALCEGGDDFTIDYSERDEDTCRRAIKVFAREDQPLGGLNAATMFFMMGYDFRDSEEWQDLMTYFEQQGLPRPDRRDPDENYDITAALAKVTDAVNRQLSQARADTTGGADSTQ